MAKGVIAPGKEDGRSKRATGRTQQFATRVTTDFHDKLRAAADRDGLKLVEVLEEAVDAYEREREEAGADIMTRLQVVLKEIAFLRACNQCSPSEREEIDRVLREALPK